MKLLKTKIRSLAAAMIFASAACMGANAQQAAPADSAVTITDSVAAKAVSDSATAAIRVETPVEQAINRPVHFDSFELVRILGLIIPFASVIILIWLLLHFRNERERDRLRVIEMSITKGCPLPTEFYTHAGKSSPDGKLQSGICWIGAGLAIMFFFGNVADDVAPIGILPVFVGIAQLAAYRARSRRQKDMERNNIPLPKVHRDDQQD